MPDSDLRLYAHSRTFGANENPLHFDVDPPKFNIHVTGLVIKDASDVSLRFTVLNDYNYKNIISNIKSPVITVQPSCNTRFVNTKFR